MTLECVLTGTLAALDEAGLIALDVLKDARSAMSEQSPWRMSQTESAEHTFQEPMRFSTACIKKADQIMRARAGAPGEFDSYTRRVEVLNFERGERFTVTFKVSNVDMDPNATDDHWVRIPSVTPVELADDFVIPEGEWRRVGSVGPNF